MIRDVLYLVFRSDGTARVGKKPRIAEDEVAVRITVLWPDGWGKVIKDIELTMPGPPDVEVLQATLATLQKP